MERPLIPREFSWLVQLGSYALLAAALLRLSMLLLLHSNWLLPSQIIGVSLLYSLLLLAGTQVPRAIGDSLMYLLGGLCWVMALSFIPRYLWPTGYQPAWMYYGSLGLLAICLLYSGARRQRWYGRMRGKGWEWIRDWAEDKPYYARRLAGRVLRTIGYSGL